MSKARAFAIVLAFIVLAVAAYLLSSEISIRNEVGPLASPRHMRTMLQPAAPPSVGQVAEWMTFEYLDRVFRLPPDALKTSLGIADPRYPRLSIRRWAVDAGIDAGAALERVKRAIEAARAK